MFPLYLERTDPKQPKTLRFYLSFVWLLLLTQFILYYLVLVNWSAGELLFMLSALICMVIGWLDLLKFWDDAV